MTPRYDTLVIEGSTSKIVPREVDGARVVSWAVGHAIAQCDALEEFVKLVAEEYFEYATVEEIRDAAVAALEKAERQNENSYDD